MDDRALTLNVEDEIIAPLEALARETGRSSERLAEAALQRCIEYEGSKASKIRDAMRRADAGEFASDEEMDAVFDPYRAADASGGPRSLAFEQLGPGPSPSSAGPIVRAPWGGVASMSGARRRPWSWHLT